MKLVHNTTAIPKRSSDFIPKKMIFAAFDFHINRSVWVKTIILNHQRDLQKAGNALWKIKGFSGEKLGENCAGFVHQTFFLSESSRTGKEKMTADPRYSAVVVLVKSHLTMEIICHEAVHAGLAHARRMLRRPELVVGSYDNMMTEEVVAYATGEIAAAINRFCHKEGIYEGSEKSP